MSTSSTTTRRRSNNTRRRNTSTSAQKRNTTATQRSARGKASATTRKRNTANRNARTARTQAQRAPIMSPEAQPIPVLDPGDAVGREQEPAQVLPAPARGRPVVLAVHRPHVGEPVAQREGGPAGAAGQVEQASAPGGDCTAHEVGRQYDQRRERLPARPDRPPHER